MFIASLKKCPSLKYITLWKIFYLFETTSILLGQLLLLLNEYSGSLFENDFTHLCRLWYMISNTVTTWNNDRIIALILKFIIVPWETNRYDEVNSCFGNQHPLSKEHKFVSIFPGDLTVCCYFFFYLWPVDADHFFLYIWLFF